jgi:hypothetical protein
MPVTTSRKTKKDNVFIAIKFSCWITCNHAIKENIKGEALNVLNYRL